MKRRDFLRTTALFLAPPTAMNAATFYVAPDGDDEDAGTSSHLVDMMSRPSLLTARQTFLQCLEVTIK
jgi:hypothetical protein